MSEQVLATPYQIEPYPHSTTRSGYYQAAYINESLAAVRGDEAATASLLTDYIFNTDPAELDLPPAVLFRFGQAQRVMGIYPESTALQDGILRHFQVAEAGLRTGYATAATDTLVSADSTRPKPVMENGKLVQRVWLPETMQRRTLAWNGWVQRQIEAGALENIFASHPAWVATKLAEGSWLPAGNLMLEPAEGLGRIQTKAHRKHDLENRWELGITDEYGSGLDRWFIMTHIVDKELLGLAEQVGDNMVDGSKLTPEVYARAYVSILELMQRNPQLAIEGALSDGTWAYSAELKELFPDQQIAALHDIAGDVVDLGPAQELHMLAQIDFATHDRTRNKAYREGRYQVRIAARLIREAGMRAVIEQFGLPFPSPLNPSVV